MNSGTRMGAALAVVAFAVGVAVTSDTQAFGGRGNLGASRAGAAAGGGFSAPSRGGQATRQQALGNRQSGRQDAQAGRQDSLQSAQSSRQEARQTAQYGRQDAAQARGDYHHDYHDYHDDHDDWDSGDAAAGFVVGAVVGGAVVAASTPSTTTVVTTTAPPPPAPTPMATPPCNVAPVPVAGVPYYKCGYTWYTAAYGAQGVIYMPVPPPPGYN